MRSLQIFLRAVLIAGLSIFPVAVIAAAPPPPPDGNKVRGEQRQSGVLSDSDRAVWRQAFSFAGRELHSAASLAAQAANDTTLRPVLEWIRLRDGDVLAPQADYDRFLAAHPDFPSLSTVRRRREAAMIDGADSAVIRGLFTNAAPLTADGKAQWALALADMGKTDEAHALARQAWRETDPDKDLERALYRVFKGQLTADDHRARLDRLLWKDWTSAARRMEPRISKALWRLADARIKLKARHGGVDKAVSAVPAELQNDAGLVYERVRFRRKSGQDGGAQDLLLASGAIGGDVRRVWVERRIQIRNLIKSGSYEKAYRIARDHGVPSGAAFAQGEFEAGWLALRFLGKPSDALHHFQTLYDNVSYPVSLARGAYWSARAHAALGDIDAARVWFGRAAGHPYTFYGQLAAHELGQRRLVLKTPPVAATADQQAFDQQKLPAIIRRLNEVGRQRLAKLFLTHMVKNTDRADIHLLSAGLVRQMDSPAVSLTAGKLAALQRVVIPDAAYPVVATPGQRGRIPPELAHAITRQESAFDQYAISHAGARGLMQLMPATAQRVARAENVAYSRARLTGDPAYNTRLGGAYLADQALRFGGYLPMAAAAYNAGPHRVDRWLVDYGDPRTSGGKDPVDWMEMIPFSETRNYAQRIMEALQVYRVRLSDKQSGPLTLAADIGLKGTYMCGARSGRPC